MCETGILDILTTTLGEPACWLLQHYGVELCKYIPRYCKRCMWLQVILYLIARTLLYCSFYCGGEVVVKYITLPHRAGRQTYSLVLTYVYGASELMQSHWVSGEALYFPLSPFSSAEVRISSKEEIK